MNNKKEQQLMDCLRWCDLPSLPEKDDKENIWIKAVALVQKADGSEGYVALRKDDNVESKIVKDFGNISIVRKIKEVYPYSFLSVAFVPEFKTKKKEERIAWLRKQGNTKQGLEELSLKDLDRMVIAIAIKAQINKEEQQYGKK